MSLFQPLITAGDCRLKIIDTNLRLRTILMTESQIVDMRSRRK